MITSSCHHLDPTDRIECVTLWSKDEPARGCPILRFGPPGGATTLFPTLEQLRQLRDTIDAYLDGNPIFVVPTAPAAIS